MCTKFNKNIETHLTETKEANNSCRGYAKQNTKSSYSGGRQHVLVEEGGRLISQGREF